MKTPSDITAAIQRRLTTSWHTDLTGDTSAWPHDFTLGTLPKATLETDFARVQQAVREWRDWATPRHLTIRTTSRRVHATTQTIPTHVTVPDIGTAATVAGPDWEHRLTRGRHRHRKLHERFGHISDHARLIRAVDGYTDTDFELLCTVADWFATHDATGLTPRQVPIEGLHAKWLNTHRQHVQHLSGKDDLGLLPRHPARVNFTYLDPAHRAAGERHHDSATVDDPFTPAYTPRVVLISENKDTAIHFPPIAGGIAVEGAGYGGNTAAAFPWLTEAPHLYYWGDIDAHGYEILNGFRQAGINVTSILMDPATYDTYERFGTNTDANNNPLTAGTHKPLPNLTDEERAVYERLKDPAWTGHRRIEQERIPLAEARQALSPIETSGS